MVKKGIVYFLALVFVIQGVLAVDTVITVHTGSNQQVTVNVLDPSTGDALQVYFVNSSETGDAIATFTSGTRGIDISIIARKAGSIFKTKRIEGQTTGGQIYINLLEEEVPVTPTPVVENTTNTTAAVETVVETTTPPVPEVQVQESTPPATESKVTGNVVGEPGSGKKIYLYILLGVIGAAVIVFLVFKVGGSFVNSQPAGDVKVVKLSERKLERELEEKERKLEEANREINKLRNQDKIKEMERRIEEEKKLIEKLRRGE